ncbi:MAG TPA: hypothetical protein VM915_08315 [Verrucomicrobiae bacterium]|nr:hypothetical protein [Verrucomicrobiae bacterium]
MTALDIVLLTALSLFVVVWWLRKAPYRPVLLLVAALVALAAAIAGVLDDRWQAMVGLAVAALMILTLAGVALRKRWATSRIPFISGTLIALLTSIAFAAILLFPVDPLPRPSGDHPVGTRSFELTDTSRPGVLGAAPNEPRRLLVRVWYPAANVTGLRPRQYFTTSEARGVSHGLSSVFGPAGSLAYLKHVRTNSFEHAPLWRADNALPVIFYSHGYALFVGQNTALMEELASHGYVVFAIQHTRDAASTHFSDSATVSLDGEFDAEAARPPSPTSRRAIVGEAFDDRLGGTLDLFHEELSRDARVVTRSAPHWVLDRLFVHDQIQGGDVPPEIAEIAAASDLNRVGEMGMSFGGSTTGAVCLIDARCAAGVNLDGADFHLLALGARMPAPFLMFHSDPRLIRAALGGQGPGRPFNEFSYEALDAAASAQAPVYRLALRNTHHLGLSDLSLFVRRPVRDPLLGSADADTMIGAQNAFVLGFFDHHLRSRANGFPDTQLSAFSGRVERFENDELRAWWRTLDPTRRSELEARITQARTAAPSQAIPVRD